MKTKLLYLLFFVSFISMSFSQGLVLDNSFGTNGKVTTSFGVNESAMSSLAIQSDNKIIACGSSYNGSTNQIVLSRYLTNGSLDNTFGNNGKVITPIGTGLENENNSVAILNNGKILVAGGTGNTTSGIDFGIVRYNSNGTLDTSFGTNGIVISDFNSETNIGRSMKVLSDNKFIIGGFLNASSSGNYPNFAIAKYNENGTLDTTFGNSGYTSINFGTISNNLLISEDSLSCIVIQADGKIVAGGFTYYNQADFGLVRLNSNGSLDTSFGSNGRVITDFGAGEEIRSIQILANGKIIASGNYNFNSDSNQKIAIAKYNANGSLDTTFGTAGKTLFDINSNQEVFVTSTELQSDDKLLVTGFVLNTDADFFIIRCNTNGTLDTSFGINGVQVIDSGVNEGTFTSITQPDGKIIIGGGISYTDTTLDFILMRFLEPTLVTNSFNINQNNFSVYPNPFTTSINLTFSLPKNEILTIDLIDSNGRLIQNLSKEKAFSSGNNSINLGLPETLSKGIYFLKISNGFENNTIKIIK
jgi:uncharacterized delta-60 repeat protein